MRWRIYPEASLSSSAFGLRRRWTRVDVNAKKNAGPEIEQAAAKAETILEEQLKRLGWGAVRTGRLFQGAPA